MVLAALASFWLALAHCRAHQQPFVVNLRDGVVRHLTSVWSRVEPVRNSTLNQHVQRIDARGCAGRGAGGVSQRSIRALAMMLDARDRVHGWVGLSESRRSVSIGRQMGLSQSDLDTLRLGALLHDIGKVGLPDDVLRKPEPLTDEEFGLIKAHLTLGARILKSVLSLAPHLPIVELHHERFDGRGYPHGLRGGTPLLARIVHCADAYDAII